MENIVNNKTLPFRFKQFSVFHHKSTMKVGTDAILLGAWCDVNNTKYILDVGTGSGVIALLLASRSNAIIDAVELDKNSVQEASKNFAAFKLNAPSIHHNDFVTYVNIINKKYDLIVTNPPFFSNSLLPHNPLRKAARHIQSLTHDNLCKGVAHILSNHGKFCVVLPYDIAQGFIKIAIKFNLNLHKQLIISPKTNALPNRINLEFRFCKPQAIITENMIIRDDKNNHSKQYKNFVSNYLIRV